MVSKDHLLDDIAKRLVQSPPEAAPDDFHLIKRIEDISKNARANWFGLLAYLAFVGVTLLGVEDADFFIPSRQTQLPLVNVSIPTLSFFWVGPILGAALYIYLQLYLQKLWEALALPEPERDGERLGSRIFPWLISDWALKQRGDDAHVERPMGWLATFVSVLLVWLAGPLLLLAFWWRSMPAHHEGLTLVIGAAALAALYAGATGWWDAMRKLGCRGKVPDDAPGVWAGRWKIPVAAAFVATVVALTWLRADARIYNFWDMDDFLEKYTRNLLARADFTDVALTPRPDDWISRETAERRFRADWCKRRDLEPEVCRPPEEEFERQARTNWCTSQEPPFEGEQCVAYFTKLESRFDDEWAEQRAEYLENLGAPDLRDADFRNASFLRAFLPKADLRGARMEGADLYGARMEGADLREAQMEGAVFMLARMEGADLYGARMEGANLIFARMEGANLSTARMEGATLWQTRMEGANLRFARMEGADLREAQMEGAVLMLARMEGADLYGARMEGAELIEARMEGANLSTARMEGALFQETGLKSTDLRAASIRGSALRSVDLAQAEHIFDEAILKTAFGDRSVTLPPGWSWPEEWPDEVIEDDIQFYGRWRHWRESQNLPWPPPGKALEWLARYESVAPDPGE